MQYMSKYDNGNLILCFEDEVFYALKNIFINSDCATTMELADYFINDLVNKDDILNNKDFVYALYSRLIQYFKKEDIVYNEENDEVYEKIDVNIWWLQFVELREKIKKHYDLLNGADSDSDDEDYNCCKHYRCNNTIKTEECYKCEKQFCSKCIDVVCCDCCVSMCNGCAGSGEGDCGCYGNCGWCGRDVDRGMHSWPCCDCYRWWCQKCERDFDCYGCKEKYLDEN